MIINTLHLKYFLVHVDRVFRFEEGMNIIRGPNEKGKSSLFEGLGYNFFGTKALAGTKAETLNDSTMDAGALNTICTFTHKGSEYINQRSFKGAEIKKDGTVVCTGQDDVTAYIENLLGLPVKGKDNPKILFAEQGKVRGALDLGPTAASEFIEKLVNFEAVDALIKLLVSELPNGSTKILEESVKQSENRLVELQAVPTIDDSIHNEKIEELEKKSKASKVQADQLTNQLSGLVLTRSNLTEAITLLKGSIAGLETQITNKQASQRTLAETLNQKVIDEQKLKEIDDELLKALDYSIYTSMPVVPEDVWDEPLESFNAELEQVKKDSAKNLQERANITAEINSLKKRLMQGGACPTCKRAYHDEEEVKRVNTATQAEITVQEDKLTKLNTDIAEQDEYYQALLDIQKSQTKVGAWLESYAHYVETYESNVPWVLAWKGPAPAFIDSSQLEADRSIIQSRLILAAEAPQKQAVITSEITGLQKQVADKQLELKGKEVELAGLEDQETLKVQKEEAVALYNKEYSELERLKRDKAVLEAQRKSQDASLEAAESSLATAKSQLKDQRDNNELIKQVKEARVIVSATLWQQVLAAASFYFSAFRGKNSKIVKEKKAFRVEGERGRLSGSTLDVLGLALMIVVSKLFSHAGFLGLDEPSAGCDRERTAAMVGTLSSAEFEQIIMVTHSDIAESGDVNVVEL